MTIGESRVTRYVIFMAACAVTALTVAGIAFLGLAPRSRTIWTAAGAVVVFFNEQIFGLGRFRREKTQTVSHDELFFPLLLLAAGPTGAVIAWAIGEISANLATRRAPLKAVFNISQSTLATSAAAMTAVLLGGTSPDTMSGVAVIYISSMVFAASMSTSMAVLLSRLQGTSWQAEIRENFREDGEALLLQVTMGTTLTVALAKAPFLLPFVLMTVILSMKEYRRWLVARRRRQHLQDILDASSEIHRADNPNDVEEALMDAVYNLVGVESELADTPPAPSPEQPYSFPILLPEGPVRYLLIVQRVPPLERDEIAIVEALTQIADVTIWSLLLLEERRLTADRLAALLKSKEAFLAAVAHQIRTPVTAIGGFSQLLTEQAFSEPERDEAVELIAAQTTEIAMLVDNLLVATRLDTDQLTVACEDIDVAADVRRMVATMKHRRRIEVAAEEGCVAHADPLRLRHILRNLVANATEHGGPRVRIGVSKTERTISVSVCDDGPGFANLEEIVASQPAGRFQPEAKTMPGSLGLGLYVVRELADMMGGSLQHERRGGETILRVRLPREAGLAACPSHEGLMV